MSKYESSNSRPDKDYFAFSYQITIKNNSDYNVQLQRRHWFITDANAEVREVEGPGVIGEKPTMPPGGSHTYSSWCPLATPLGRMFGYYLMENLDTGESFKAHVPEFDLTAEFLLN